MKELNYFGMHACGEIGDVIPAESIHIPGENLSEKLQYLNTDGAELIRQLVGEPWGKAQRSVNLLYPSSAANCSAGFIILQPDGAHAMSGSNCMCVSTMLTETGKIQAEGEIVNFSLETPAGIVPVETKMKNGRCLGVSLDMPPAFVVDLDIELEVDGLGKVKGHTVYGGVFYFLVDVAQLGCRITPEDAGKLVECGRQILKSAKAKMKPVHPDNPAISGIAYVMFCDSDRDQLDIIRNATYMYGRFDRSPCGTGCNARIAVMHALGLVKAGDIYRARSIIDTEFKVEFLSAESVNSRENIRTKITGSAYMYSKGTLYFHDFDPLRKGITVADLWQP